MATSKWGAADEIGAANYITPELVAKAAQLVKLGKTYHLGIETNSKPPVFPPRNFKIMVVQPGRAGIPGLGPNNALAADKGYEFLFVLGAARITGARCRPSSTRSPSARCRADWVWGGSGRPKV